MSNNRMDSSDPVEVLYLDDLPCFWHSAVIFMDDMVCYCHMLSVATQGCL